MSVFCKSLHFSLLEISVADHGEVLILIIKAESGSVRLMSDMCCSCEVIKGRERVPPTNTLSSNFSHSKFLVCIDHANRKLINSSGVEEGLFPATIPLAGIDPERS